jgi:hypothetical protein
MQLALQISCNPVVITSHRNPHAPLAPTEATRDEDADELQGVQMKRRVDDL